MINIIIIIIETINCVITRYTLPIIPRLIKFDIFIFTQIEFIRLKSCESFRYVWIRRGRRWEYNNGKMETDDKRDALFCLIWYIELFKRYVNNCQISSSGLNDSMAMREKKLSTSIMSSIFFNYPQLYLIYIVSFPWYDIDKHRSRVGISFVQISIW